MCRGVEVLRAESAVKVVGDVGRAGAVVIGDDVVVDDASGPSHQWLGQEAGMGRLTIYGEVRVKRSAKILYQRVVYRPTAMPQYTRKASRRLLNEFARLPRRDMQNQDFDEPTLITSFTPGQGHVDKPLTGDKEACAQLGRCEPVSSVLAISRRQPAGRHHAGDRDAAW